MNGFHDKVKFYQTDIQKKILIDKIKSNPSLKEVFTNRKYMTEDVDQDLQQRLNGIIDNFYTALIIGKQGSLKSSFAQGLAKKFDKTYHAGRIQFEYDKFKRNIEQSNPKETNSLDESVFTHGAGSTRLVQEIQNLIETLRQRQNSMTITTPENKYFPENIFTYVFEMIDTCILATCPHNPELHEPRNCKCWEEKTAEIKECYARAVIKNDERYLGFYVLKIEWGNEIWNTYQREKKLFMESMKDGEIHNLNYQETAKEAMQHPEFKYYNRTKRSLKLLIEQIRPGLTMEENQMLVEQIRVYQDMTQPEPEKQNEGETK